MPQLIFRDSSGNRCRPLGAATGVASALRGCAVAGALVVFGALPATAVAADGQVRASTADSLVEWSTVGILILAGILALAALGFHLLAQSKQRAEMRALEPDPIRAIGPVVPRDEEPEPIAGADTSEHDAEAEQGDGTLREPDVAGAVAVDPRGSADDAPSDPVDASTDRDDSATPVAAPAGPGGVVVDATERFSPPSEPDTDPLPGTVTTRRAHDSPYPNAAPVEPTPGTSDEPAAELAAELAGGRSGDDPDREFVAGLGDRVLVRAVAFLDALADGTPVDSAQLAERLDAPARAVSGLVVSPMARRARTLGVELPYEGMTDPGTRRRCWRDRSGSAAAMLAAARAELADRIERGDIGAAERERFARIVAEDPAPAEDVR